MYLWLGIKLCNKSVIICNRKILQELELKIVFFPICLHSTAIFLQMITIADVAKFKAYDMFLNTLLIFLPCAMWWSLFKNRNSIRLLIKFLLQTKKRRTHLKNSFILIIAFTIYWFSFMTSLIITAAIRCNLIYSNNNAILANDENSVWCQWRHITKHIILHLQLELMPFLFAILYFSICINMIKIFDDYIKTLVKLKCNCNVRNLHVFLGDYVELVKYAGKFGKIFSVPLLWFVWHVLCIIALLFLDTLSFNNKTYFDIIDAILETISFILIIAILSVCADQISLKAHTFKEILYDLKTDRLLENNLIFNGIIDIVLNRENISITLFRVIHFDRCFLLKSIAAIVAHSVIYYQLTEEKTPVAANNTDTCTRQ